MKMKHIVLRTGGLLMSLLLGAFLIFLFSPRNLETDLDVGALDVQVEVVDYSASIRHYDQTVSVLFENSVLQHTYTIYLWAEHYNLNPNFLAALIQVSSCGELTYRNDSGAAGLFGVPSRLFDPSEDILDPNTNAMYALGLLSSKVRHYDEDYTLALMDYLGGFQLADAGYDALPAYEQAFVHRVWQLFSNATLLKNQPDTAQIWADKGLDVCGK